MNSDSMNESANRLPVDQLVIDTLSAPLPEGVEVRLREKLAHICDELICGAVSIPVRDAAGNEVRSRVELIRELQIQPGRPSHRLFLFTTAAASICVVALLAWFIPSRRENREIAVDAVEDLNLRSDVRLVLDDVHPVQSPSGVDRMTSKNSPEDPAVIPNNTNVVSGSPVENGFGSLVGQFVWKGTVPSSAAVAILSDQQTSCGQEIPDESFLVDTDTGGVKNVVIYKAKAGPITHEGSMPIDPVIFDAQCARFSPHVMIVRVDQNVILRNQDPFLHSFHSNSSRNVSVNTCVSATQENSTTVKMTVPERLPFKFSSDVFPFMSAYWLVLDHPYAAISTDDGRFMIPRLPAGTHEFIVWHEKHGGRKTRLTIQIGSGQQTDLGAIPMRFSETGI